MIRNSVRNNRISYIKRTDRIRKGFTLVEVLVVVVILSIVAAIAVPALMGFIDKGKESEYKAHAEAALTATQSALSDLYNDAGNSLSPKKRANIQKIAGGADGTEFTVWTAKVLWDGKTKALEENVGSYTIIKAIYKENDSVYMYYDGTNWTKYDNEIDAKIAAVGSVVNANGDKVNKDLGNNVIFVWPYKRDFAYLNGTLDPTNQRTDSDDPNIKIVTFVTDPNYSSMAYFHRIGKGVNTGKESVKIIFWKEDGVIKSNWNDEVFEESEDYKYKFYSDDENRVKFLGWKDSQDGIAKYFNAVDVGNYIFSSMNEGDENTPAKTEFTFYAGVEPNESYVRDSIVSKDKLNSLVMSSGTTVNGYKKVPMSQMGGSAVLINQEKDENNESLPAVYAWIDGNNLTWCSEAPVVYMPKNCDNFFKGNTNVGSFNFWGFDPANIITMNNMFQNCTGLTKADLSGYSGALQGVSGMFNGCSSLEDFMISGGFDTSGVSSFENMFNGCASLSFGSGEVALDTSSAVSFKGMFNGCSSVTKLDLSGWNTSNLAGDGLEGTFSGCTNLKTLNMNDWNMSGITNLDNTFNGLRSLTSIDMGGGWTLTSCRSMNGTFSGCSSLTSIDVSKLHVSSASLTSMTETFAGCTSLKSVDFTGITFANVTDVSGILDMGTSGSQLATVKFDDATDTSKLSDMSNMFAGCNAIKNLDLTKFDTRNASNFTGMFNNMTNVETITVSTKFVVPESAGIMFTNDTKLSGGRTSFESTGGDTTSQYAKIDGWKKQDGYFKGQFNDVILSKALFSAKFDSVGLSVAQQTGEYSIDELEALGATRVDEDFENEDALYYIYAWKDESVNVVKWWTNADIAYMPADCSGFFNGNTNLKIFSFEGFDTSKIVNMEMMFNGCKNLTSISFGEYFETPKLTNLYQTFQNCSSLKSIDMSNWTMNKIDSMGYIFNGCSNLAGIIIKDGDEYDWHLDVCRNLSFAFAGTKLTNKNSHNLFNRIYTSNKLTNLQGTFKDNKSVDSLDLTNMNVSNVTTLQQTFANCTNLKSIDLTGWDTKNVKSLYETFYLCQNLTGLDVSAFNTQSVTTMYRTFRQCEKLTSLRLNSWNTSNVQNLQETFNRCFALTTLEVSGWNVSKNKNLMDTFARCTSLTTLDIQGWNVQNVENMQSTFNNCDSLVSIDISMWNTKNVKIMQQICNQCDKLEYFKMGNGNTNSITNMTSAFNECPNLKVVDLSGISTNNVTTYQKMFYKCPKLTTVYVSADFSMANNTNTSEMFKECNSIVGQAGTTFIGDNKKYAVIDQGPTSSKPGYFTLKIGE